MAEYKVVESELKKLSFADLIALQNYATNAVEHSDKSTDPLDRQQAIYFEKLEYVCGEEINQRIEKILPTKPAPPSRMRVSRVPGKEPRL